MKIINIIIFLLVATGIHLSRPLVAYNHVNDTLISHKLFFFLEYAIECAIKVEDS